MKFKFSAIFPAALALNRLALPAAADTPPPAWQIPTICQNAKSDEECSRLESSSRNSVLDRWSKAPEADRTACLAHVQKNGGPSYWRLLDCLGNRALQTMEH
ncbi:hypothetical protein [Hyphomicrobium sp.]|jgi:hypothetical protein|uniref:hypothetical protein n=1 Tax=Hyphomicrobium sp. TaxID=82 RepID=UPI002BC9B1C9|nr:hypothetical protein [Hyphomicrobium sp.]HVZ04042.1 hypothetical protein [Hyphomicrobium sp.]